MVVGERAVSVCLFVCFLFLTNHQGFYCFSVDTVKQRYFDLNRHSTSIYNRTSFSPVQRQQYYVKRTMYAECQKTHTFVIMLFSVSNDVGSPNQSTNQFILL